MISLTTTPSKDSGITNILYFYPILFLACVFFYLLARIIFPQYFILRIHKLNTSYVITRSKDYLFYREPESSISDQGSYKTSTSSTTPLLQSLRQNPANVNQDSSYNSIEFGQSMTGANDTIDLKRITYNEYLKFSFLQKVRLRIGNGLKSLFLVLFVKDKQVLDLCGLDQLLILRMIRLMTKLLLGYMIPCLLFLLPLYQVQQQDPSCLSFCDYYNLNSSSNNDAYNSKCVCNFIQKSSLAMLKCTRQSSDNSSFSFDLNCIQLWGPVFAMTWCTLLTLFMLQYEYKKVIYLRNNIYWKEKKPPQLYTILLDEIPAGIGLSSKQDIFEHFNGLFPNKIVKVDVAATKGRRQKVLTRLRKLGLQRNNVLYKLQRVKFKNTVYTKPQTKIMFCHKKKYFARIDAVEDLESRLEKYNKEFCRIKKKYKRYEEKGKTDNDDNICTSAFITFNSAAASTIVRQTLIHERKNITVIGAPEPSNIYFEFLGNTPSNLTFRRYFSTFLFVLIIIFWGTLTTAVTGIANPSTIKSAFPFLRRFFSQYEEFLSLVAPLTLIILLSTVSPLIRYIASLQVRASESEIDNIKTFYYFFFVVVQVFLFYGVAGTVFITLENVINSPKTLLYSLAQTIPQNATFYIGFIVTKMFTMLGLGLLRLPQFAMQFLRRILFGTDYTKTDIAKVHMGLPHLRHPTHSYLASTKSQLFLIYFIATTYVAIQPLIAPTAFVFFIFAYIVYGNNFLNVSLQRYDTGGKAWPMYHVFILSGILTSQITLIAVLTIKGGFEQVFILWFLFFFTIGASHIINQRYKKLIENIPLNIALQIDKESKKRLGKLKFENSSLFEYESLTGRPGYLKPNRRSGVTLFNYEQPILREPDIMTG